MLSFSIKHSAMILLYLSLFSGMQTINWFLTLSLSAFFDISPKETALMDPQQRLALELVWEAIENASYNARELKSRDVAFILGICNNDYASIASSSDTSIYSGTGNFFSVAAGRIAYTLGLNGPCFAVDTAWRLQYPK